MPSHRRQAKRRNRSKILAVNVVRLKMAVSEASASGSYPKSKFPGVEAAMDNRPRPGWRASLHGFWAKTHRSLTNMWLNKRLWLLMLSICILLLVGYYLYSEFPNGHSLENNEDASGQSLEKDFISEALLNFFFPTTCILRENQVVKACNELQDLNESECLRQKCCFSSSGTGSFKCFAPLEDEPKQMMRMFGVGAVSLMILGCLPFYYCCLYW
ncbi:FMR1 neighbor protein [Aotus nancymaae]|uniref:FMR1 neighbor protein n=1 Tax=Aotus nancymaae TaxID=37293 RepID=UPI00062643AD|nr:fragile X mental retardation 1 neighbor protein [Aotus nancymaae]